MDVVPSVRNHFLEHRFSWRNRRLPAKFSTATLVDQPLDAWLVGRWQVGDQGKSRAYLKMDRLDFAAAMANDDTQGLPVPSWGAIPLSNWLGNHVLYMENMCMHINTHTILWVTHNYLQAWSVSRFSMIFKVSQSFMICRSRIKRVRRTGHWSVAGQGFKTSPKIG